MIITTGKHPALDILRVGADRCIVYWTCCGRTATARLETIERHIREKRQECPACRRRAKIKATKSEPRRGTYNDQPGAVINGMMRVGRHDWWPMRGPMGR